MNKITIGIRPKFHSMATRIQVSAASARRERVIYKQAKEMLAHHTATSAYKELLSKIKGDNND